MPTLVPDSPKVDRRFRRRDPATIDPARSPPISCNPDDHLGLIVLVAKRMIGMLHERFGVEIGDLVSWGYLRLVDVFRTQEPTGSTYLVMHLRGAMWDGARHWAGVHLLGRETRRYRTVENQLAQRLGRWPTSTELREELGLSEERFNRWRQWASPPGAWEDIDPAVELRTQPPDHEALIALQQGLTQLSDAEQFVVHGRFTQDRELKDLGAELGVSFGRVAQIEKAALRKLQRLAS